MKTMIKQSNTIMEQNQEEKQEYIVLPREYMIEGIVNATKEMHRMLQETRAENGKLYNEKNEYEQCMRRFDVDDPEKVLAEYEAMLLGELAQKVKEDRVEKFENPAILLGLKNDGIV